MCEIFTNEDMLSSFDIGGLYSRGLYGTFVQWGLTFWNLNKHHCFIVLHISFGRGDWSFVSEGLSPPKAPRGDWTVWQNFSLQEKICQTFCLQAWQGPKWYNACKCLLCFVAKSVLGLFCLHLNTIGWSTVVIWQAWYAETIGWDLGAYG